MKPSLVLLHGALGSACHWQTILPLLENDFNLFVPDFPGHGNSLQTACLNVDELVNFLSDYLKEHHLHSPYIAGYSMGGYVALMAAAKQKIQCAQLLCLATKMDWSNGIAEEEAAKLNPETLLPILPKLQAEHGQNFDGLLNATASVIRSIGHAPIATADMRLVHTACTFIRGEKDKMVSANDHVPYMQFLNVSQYIEMPAQGHLLEKMDPALVAKLFKQVFQ